jgi:hypothetical protein
MNIFRLDIEPYRFWNVTMYRVRAYSPWPFWGPLCYTRRYAVWAWFKYLLSHWLYLASFKTFRWWPKVCDESSK